MKVAWTMGRQAQDTPQSVLITGTTSGLGRALLEFYAGLGVRVVAVNRRRLEEVEARFPAVRFECVDVRDEQAVSELVEDLARHNALPQIFFLNAGINRCDNDESFELSPFREVVDTNLYGALHFVKPLTRLEGDGINRHVVAISSMASYVANPYGLGYHASKKALSACFEVWSQMYRDTDLIFQQVLLGPVESEIFTMEERLPAWMVQAKRGFSTSPEVVVQKIVEFTRTRQSKLHYPRRAIPLYLGMGCAQKLVPGFFRGRRTLGGRPRR